MAKVNGKEVGIPPAWCSGICRNAMSEKCLTECCVRRNCYWFEPKKMSLPDMPAFPMREWLEEFTKDERAVSTTLYLFAIVEHLNGRDLDYSRSSQVSTNHSVELLLSRLKERHPDVSGREAVDPGTEKRADGMAD